MISMLTPCNSLKQRIKQYGTMPTSMPAQHLEIAWPCGSQNSPFSRGCCFAVGVGQLETVTMAAAAASALQDSLRERIFIKKK